MIFGGFLVLDKTRKELKSRGSGIGSSVESQCAGIVPAAVLSRTGPHLGYGSGRGSPLSGTQGNRVATVALLKTV